MASWSAKAEPVGLTTVGAGAFKHYLERVKPSIDERIGQLFLAYGGAIGRDRALVNLLSRGKRLRGGMALATFETFAGPDRDEDGTLDLAAAIEIAHSASLVLDDMLDGDEERRGDKALHVSRGNKRALLEMIGTLSVPYAIVIRNDPNMVAELAAAHRVTVEGAMLEVENVQPTFDHYDRVIERKTGTLFSLAATFGARSAGCGERTVEILAKYGRSIGMVMQVADDLADLKRRLDGRISPSKGSEAMLLQCLRGDRAVPVSRLPQADEMNIDERSGRLLDRYVLSARDLVAKAVGSDDRPNVGRPVEARIDALMDAPVDIAQMMLDGG